MLIPNSSAMFESLVNTEGFQTVGKCNSISKCLRVLLIQKDFKPQ